MQGTFWQTVVNQFLEIGTSDITFMGRDRELKWLAFIFPLQSLYVNLCKINISTVFSSSITLKLSLTYIMSVFDNTTIL